jgi:hypothetical protein
MRVVCASAARASDAACCDSSSFNKVQLAELEVPAHGPSFTDLHTRMDLERRRVGEWESR